MSDDQTPEPAFDTKPVRDQIDSWPGIGKFLATAERDLRMASAELAITEEVPIQMLTAVVKLAENSVALREQIFAMHSNFTRWLDSCDGKQVAEEAGGADGLG